ncbi:hypothetical protein GCM10009712_42180 [Pseudarthrobacter sulfonivorans]|uniref:hypothetical protein n=1 Tax=Pseudarthrobacter sulfonivorans TaxID=121292 RepID=UPI001CC2E6C7|nr:hypothetical protein [Pseudarthrobacter sulfonivorans]
MVCTNALVTGDVVIADVDGVVVVPAEPAAEVAAAARTCADNEEGKRKRSGAGELGLDVYSNPQGSGTSTRQLLGRTCKARGPRS